MHKILLRIAISLGLIVTLGCGVLFNEVWFASFRQVTWEAEYFEESGSALTNPDCGWYEIYGYHIGDGAALSSNLSSHLMDVDRDIRLVLLEINLQEYRTTDISEEGLQQIEEVLSGWERLTKCHMVLRFLYDWNGHGEAAEPDNIQQIQRHITQVAPLVNAHKGSILVWQGILVGDVGEMHGSKFLDEESLGTLMSTIADAIDPQIFLAVRTPRQLRAILDRNATLSSRLGLFNDGMLGSVSDLGSYDDRQAELEFQQELCKVVPNGGEVVIDNPYNDCPAAYDDLATMHVSYLNHWHHKEVLDKWKATAYQGDNTAFAGVSAYDYIGAHLGYRYVLRDTDVVYNYKNQTATLSIDISNVGFAPAYRKYESRLLLVNTMDNSTSVVSLDLDNRTWSAGEDTTVSVDIPLADCEDGTYQVYLKLWDTQSGEQIEFGNTMECSGGGYYLGTLTLDNLFGD